MFTFLERELITPPLEDGLILPGVTRDSLLSISEYWNEFKVVERYPTMNELRKALSENRVNILSNFFKKYFDNC